MSSVHEVVEIDEPCPRGGSHTAIYVDSFRGRRRSVDREVKCDRCGEVSSAQMADLPVDAKQRLVAAHGEWEVVVDPIAHTKAMSALRDLEHLSLDKARARVREAPQMLRGTQAESCQFADQLERRGVDRKYLTVRRVAVVPGRPGER